MKRWIAALLALCLILALGACGTQEDTAESVSPAVTAASGSDLSTATAPPSASDTVTSEETTQSSTGESAEPTGEVDTTELDEAVYEQARTFIKNSVDELILAIGQPIHKEEAEGSTSSTPKYVLTYPGFYVYSTRTSAGEMIDDMALME